MEDQFVIGDRQTAAGFAAAGVWDGGGSGGSSGGEKSSGSNPIPVEIRPDEDEPVLEPTVPEETVEATQSDEVVVVSIFGEEEATEAVETLATEAPVNADLTESGGASGSWLLIAAGLAVVLVIALMIGKKRSRK